MIKIVFEERKEICVFVVGGFVCCYFCWWWLDGDVYCHRRFRLLSFLIGRDFIDDTLFRGDDDERVLQD